MVSKSRTCFINYLSLQRLAPATQEAYLGAIKGLADYYSTGKPETLSNEQIQDYLLALQYSGKKTGMGKLQCPFLWSEEILWQSSWPW